MVNGYWRPIGLGAKLGPKFICAHDAGAWANKNFGLGNWTVEWCKKDNGTRRLGQ